MIYRLYHSARSNGIPANILHVFLVITLLASAILYILWGVSSLYYYAGQGDLAKSRQEASTGALSNELLSKALSSFQTSLYYNPNNPRTWFTLAGLQLNLNNVPHRRDRDNWKESAFKALSKAPAWDMPLLMLAGQCDTSVANDSPDNPDACLSLYEQAIRRNPSYGFPHLKYAALLVKTAAANSRPTPLELATICKEYRTALWLMNGTFGNTKWYLSEEQRAYQDSLSLCNDYETSRNIDPFLTRQWQLMGRALGHKPTSVFSNFFDLIVADLDRYKNVQQSHRSFALGLEEAGRLDDAKQILLRFASLHPENGEGWKAIVEFLIRNQSKVGKAQLMTMLRSAKQSANFSSSLWSYFGKIACAHDDSELAGNFFDTAINSDPENPSFIAARGDCFVRQNDLSGALSDYQLAVKLDPGSALYWTGLGRIQLKLGDYLQAVRSLQKALTISPGDPEATRVLRQLGIR